jgi:hypothetical protein
MGWLSDALSVVTALVLPELYVVVKLVTMVLEKLGLIDAKDNPEEMGDKMLQAEEQGITPENFDNYDDYYQAIKDFELDPEKSAQLTERQKLDKYSAVGLAHIQDVVGDGAISFFTEVATKLSPEFRMDSKVQGYLDSFKGNIDKLNSYFESSLPQHEFSQVEKQILSVEKQFAPEKSNDEILTELDKERNALKS